MGSFANIKLIASMLKDEASPQVVVVSAMAGVTNTLISNANKLTSMPNPREMDLLLATGEQMSAAYLCMALQELGLKARSFTGQSAGIITNEAHTKAKIRCIHTKPLEDALKAGFICVVAGFQGVDINGEITTLGRGGSDLSAVALAGALKAKACEIYTDVDGIFTTDPRIEANAKKLDLISFEEMLEFSALGAKVLQNRSVELAKKLNVSIHTKNTFSKDKGTVISKEGSMEEALVSGIALDTNQARISLKNIRLDAQKAAKIFNGLNNANIHVDIIVQNIGEKGLSTLGFTVPQSDLLQALKAIKNLTDCEIIADENIVKVSLVGIGMKSHAGIASTAFSALAKEGINMQMIATSEIKISMIIEEKYAKLAVRVLHDAYELAK